MSSDQDLFGNAIDPDDPVAVENARREYARNYRNEHGSMPPDFPIGAAIDDAIRAYRGRISYKNPDAFFDKGVEYLAYCRDNFMIPTYSGLTLYLGYNSQSSLSQYVRRRPEFRRPHGALMMLLQMGLEMALAVPGMNTTGLWKRLTNIPSGFDDDDPQNMAMVYPFKERRQEEIVGLDATTLEVKVTDRPVAEVWKEMLKAGRRLAAEPERSPSVCEEEVPDLSVQS
jgi:hypothetical protein